MAAVKPFSWLGINANATISESKIKDFTEYIDKSDDSLSYPQEIRGYGTTDIAFSPNLTGAAGITISPFRRLSHGQTVSFEILNKYVGKQYLDNTSNDNRAIDAYDLTDVRIHYSVRLKPFKEVSATLALNNLFNKMYSSNGYTFSYIYDNTLTTQNYYFPQAGFNWLLGLNLKW
jgi:iron complex outermembrane receptor protein